MNTTLDTVDINPGDGLAEDASGNTSLRAAIMEANALAGNQSILLSSATHTLGLAGTEMDNASVGDLDITDTGGTLTIRGVSISQSVIDGAGIDRVFDVFSSATLNLQDLTITGGSAAAAGEEDGGGIYNEGGTIALTRISVQSNTATEAGGGIFHASGSLAITDTTIDGNSASSGSTGGGGLFANGGTVDIVRSTISGNSALNGGGAFLYDGSGMIQSSTLSGNMATSLGGGLANLAVLSITHSTITNNNSGGTGGGITNYGDPIDVFHTIIAGNTSSGGERDIQGDFNSLGYNLVGVDSVGAFTATGDQAGTSGSPIDSLLDGLANNGGLTQTHALLAGSPAIDAGEPLIASPPATDQRGQNRVEDGDGNMTATIDIGAFELVAAAGSVSASATSWSGPTVLTMTGAVMTSSSSPTAAKQKSPGPYAPQALSFGIPGTSVWTVTVGSGDAFENIDFGVRALPGEIRGQKFHDLDGDGVKDPFEPGLSGWEIYLDENDNQLLDVGETFVTTDTDGTFAFLNLDSEQSYLVDEVAQTGWVQTLPTTAGGRWSIDLGAGEIITSVDFGNVEDETGGVGTGDIQGVLFSDGNGNGVQDGGENGLSGEMIYLDLNDNGLFDGGEPTESTDGTGAYQFVGLATGEYAVRMILPNGGTQTSPEGVDNRPLSTTLPTETQPNSLVAGDFNRDGSLDLAVVNAGNTTLSVFLSDTAGSFLPAMEVIVGTAPLSIQAVQFDDDNGDLQIDDNDYVDLIVGYSGTNFISVLFNDQSGGFTRSDAISPYAPWYLAPGDFDDDGDVDVITVHLNQSNVSFLERIPGGFVSPAATIASGQEPASLIAVQLSDDNGDLVVDVADRLDMAWVDILPGANTVTALFNDGGGAFTKVTKSVGGRPFAVATGDLNGNGFNDLAVTVPESNQVALLLNNQNDNFSLPVFVAAGLGPTAIAAGDLDGDGDIDLAVTNASEAGFTLMRNDGTGTFIAEISGVAAFPNPLAVGIVAAQLDNDPSLDLAIANGLGSESVLFLANRLVDRAQRVTVQSDTTISGVSFGIAGIAPLSADFDSDTDIDGFDFLAWQRGFGTLAPNAAKADGDADNDQDVDAGDLTTWQTQFGQPAPPVAAASSASAESPVPTRLLVTAEFSSVSELTGVADPTGSLDTGPFHASLLNPLINPHQPRARAFDWQAYRSAIVAAKDNLYDSVDQPLPGFGYVEDSSRHDLIPQDDDEPLELAIDEAFATLTEEEIVAELTRALK